MRTQILHGDCREVLATLPDASVEAVVTDPPYDLPGGFMGKAWDRSGVAFDPVTGEAVKRVLKPGGHLCAVGGTRTFHRVTVAIEDAGFEIRDSVGYLGLLGWVHGQGFPKSKNLDGEWQGWGTALKPAWEPIILARKPLAASTVSANVLATGCGALNIAATRIAGTGNKTFRERYAGDRARDQYRTGTASGAVATDQGRWPPNVALDEAAAALLDQMSGNIKSRNSAQGIKNTAGDNLYSAFSAGAHHSGYRGEDSGASRFFYVAKASRRERGDGNGHPTVKPLALMQWLVRLVTPPGGTVLDPFLGSGTTGIAAQREGFGFIGIEREAEYIEIARRRIAADAPLLSEAAD